MFEYPRGYQGHGHRHRLAQVVYPVRGVVSVETDAGTWVVTTRTAVAISPWRQHRVAAYGNASLRSIFVDPDVHPGLIDTVTTVQISGLLHELISEAGHHYTDLGDNVIAASVIDLIAQLLPTMRRSDTSVWVPSVDNPLLRPAVAALEADPADATSINEWARRVALSTRHFSRLFRQEAGVPFSTWRSLVQVRHALVLLAEGRSVTRVAMDLGYGSTSSFIEMFKRQTGKTPGAASARAVTVA